MITQIILYTLASIGLFSIGLFIYINREVNKEVNKHLEKEEKESIQNVINLEDDPEYIECLNAYLSARGYEDLIMMKIYEKQLNKIKEEFKNKK